MFQINHINVIIKKKLTFVYLIALSVKPYKGEPKVGPCHSNDSSGALKKGLQG